MNLIKKYKSVLAVVFTVLVLIVVRLLSPGHFKIDAKRLAEPSVLRSNLITVDQAGSLPGEKLIINLSLESGTPGMAKVNTINISPDSLLSKDNLNTIKNHEGPVLIYSSETAVSARVWMVLSQLGYRNIFILSNNANNEILNYKFRPDTIIQPEF